jgi:hypothetical protein
MKERSYTVRVYTHPKTWRNADFLSSEPVASKLPPDATQSSHQDHSQPSYALPQPNCPVGSLRSIPRTCTVRRHSPYSISSDVIQRVICKPVSPVFSQSLAREIA